MVTTYQLYYNEATKEKVSPIATGIYTAGTVTPLFEAYWLANTPPPQHGYMAIISPEFERKTNKRIAAIHSRLTGTNVDVLMPPNAIVSQNNHWYQAEKYHPGFIPIAGAALHRAGLIHYILKPSYTLYSNYFWMRAEFWHEYQKELKAIIAAMEEPLFSTPCMHRSGSGHTREQLQLATGYHHYTWKPFICERLIGSFIYHRKMKVGYF